MTTIYNGPDIIGHTFRLESLADQWHREWDEEWIETLFAELELVHRRFETTTQRLVHKLHTGSGPLTDSESLSLTELRILSQGIRKEIRETAHKIVNRRIDRVFGVADKDA